MRIFPINLMRDIVKKNPKLVFFNTDGVKFNLTKIKLNFQFGVSCSVCGMDGRYYIINEEKEDASLCGLTDYGCQVEMATINKKTVCDICKNK